MYDPNALSIHIDGSAYRNPGHEGGYCGIAEFPESLNLPPKEIFRESYNETTNNRMELRACIRAIEDGTKIAKPMGISRVTIFTDSEYVYYGKDSAIYWRGNGWRSKEGRPIENADLWKKFLSVSAKSLVPTTIYWKKGKTSEILKEVDNSAKSAAKNILKIDDMGYLRGKVARAKLKGGSAMLFPANGQQVTVRIYGKQFKRAGGKEECKIIFEPLSEDATAYEGKYAAYASMENTGKLHRAHHYKVQFDNNPKYPQIKEVIEEIFLAE